MSPPAQNGHLTQWLHLTTPELDERLLLLTPYGDFFCCFSDNIILKSDLKICQEELAAERERAGKRECQLVQRIQQLTSQLRATENLHEGISRSALVRCVSLDLGDEFLTVQASRRRRIHSCSAALPTISSSKPRQEQRLDPKVRFQ